MFLRHYNVLTALARPEGLPSPLATGQAREWAQAGAHLAMSRELAGMPLSARLHDPAAYLRLQKARRQALEALIAVDADAPALERITDLICMLCEEATWSENPKGAPFDDDQHPEIDFQCAETLMLLAWVSRALSDRLGSRVTGKLLYEARRRVFSPFLPWRLSLHAHRRPGGGVLPQAAVHTLRHTAVRDPAGIGRLAPRRGAEAGAPADRPGDPGQGPPRDAPFGRTG